MSRAHRHLRAIQTGNAQAMYEATRANADDIDVIYARLGINPNFQDTQGNQPINNPPPSPAQFSVVGFDGTFRIAVTNPQDIQPATAAVLQQNAQASLNPTGAAIFHQLQSGTDTNFDANSNVSTYGPSTDVTFTIPDPNQTKFWRLRSSFDQTNWNAWQIFQSAATCGPIAIWSGLVRNSASALVDSATTAQGTNPLTQNGTLKEIDVAATIWDDGDQVINYNSGSVTPTSYGLWLIYASDQFRKGGTVTFLATQNSSDITASLYNVYFGQITTSSGGGGTGSGGGGGTCCRAGVPYIKIDGTAVDCSTLAVGDVLKGIDGGPEVIQQIDIIPARPCFHLEFDTTGKLTKKDYLGDFTVYRIHLDRSHTYLAGQNGIIDGACSEHIIQYAGGGFVNVFEAVVGEAFNVQSGYIGSHNLRKF